MKESDIDIIENYLTGKLSAEKQKEVEDRLLTDREFAQRVEIFKTLPPLVSEESHDFRNELEGIYQEYRKENSSARTISRRTFLMAASLALLISVTGILIWLLPASLTPQEIYATHFTVPADNITVRNDQEIVPALQSAMESYNEQAYTDAVAKFENILQNDPDNAPVLFYSGVSYLILGETDQAVQKLQKVAQIENTAYGLTSRWYLGLAYLKQDNTAQAREIFSSLQESSSSYATKADTLLQQLEEF